MNINLMDKSKAFVQYCLLTILLTFVSSNALASQISQPLTVDENPSYDGSFKLYLPSELWYNLDTSQGAQTSGVVIETYYPPSGSSTTTTYSLANSYKPVASKSFSGKAVGTYHYKASVTGPTPGGGYGYNWETAILIVEVLPASQAPTPTPTPEPTATPIPTPTPTMPPDLGGSADIESTTGNYNVVIPSSVWPSFLIVADGDLIETYHSADGTEVTRTVRSDIPKNDSNVSVAITGRDSGYYTYSLYICGFVSVNEDGIPNVPQNCGSYSIANAEVFLITEEEYEAPVGKLDLSRYDIYYGDFNDDLIDGDIYFHGKEQFILIAGEVSVPIILQAPESFVMYNLNSGGYTTALRLSESELANYTKLQANKDYYEGDFNGDNQTDYLIRGFETGAPSAVVIQTNSGWPTTATTSVSAFDISNRGNTLKIEDHNNDGFDDVLVVSSSGYVLDVVYASSSGMLDDDTYKAADESQLFDIATFPANAVGKTAGEFRVNEMGAATYSIPLYTPQGSAGVSPSMGISYSSQGSNGVLGQGWSLNAYSGISRCRSVLAIDGHASGISWTNADQFCLDGQRLLLNSGTHGSDGAVYRTEIDTFTVVKIHGNINGEPDYFTLEGKDGSISYFGANYDGLSQNAKQVFPNGKTLTWNQSRTEDNAQNAINYFYSQDSGKDFRLVRVEYAYGAAGFVDGINPNATLTFDYERREDLLTGYISGQQTRMQWRLSGVNVYNKVTANKNVRNYHIFYNRELAGDYVKRRSLVAAVQECIGSKCKQPTRFEWDVISDGDFTTSTNAFSESTSDIKEFKVGDINGDGVQDLVWLQVLPYANVDHKLHYAISENGRLVKKNFTDGNGNLRFPENEKSEIRIEVFDYNLDGRSDVAVYRSRDVPENDRWTIYLSVPSSTDGEWALSHDHIVTNATGADALVADINGDGLTDIVDENKVYYLGKRANAPASSNQFYAYPSTPVTIAWNGVGALQPDRIENSITATDGELKYYDVGDFNGDGLVDVIGGYQLVTETQLRLVWNETNRTPEKLYAFIQTANGFDKWLDLGERGESAALDYDDLIPYLTDLNQDGLSDLVTKERPDLQTRVYGRINSGTGFFAKQELAAVTAGTPLYFFDYNRDGFVDLLETQINVTRVHLWDRDNSTFAAPKTITDLPGGKIRRVLEDFNGDGYADHFYLKDEQFKLQVYSKGGAVTDQITAIDSGYGDKTQITYERLNATDNYQAINVDVSQSGTGENCIWMICLDYTTYSADDFYEALNSGIDSGFATVLPSSIPKLELAGPIQLVTQVSKSIPASSLNNDVDSPGGNTGTRSVSTKTISTSYQYREAKIQAGGRGFLGFHGIVTTDDQSEISTSTTYRQDFPFIGSPIKTVVTTADGSVISETHNVYAIEGLPSNASSLLANGTGSLGSLKTYLKTSYKARYATASSEASSGVVSVIAGDGIPNVCVEGATECPAWSDAATSQKVVREEITRNVVDSYGNVTQSSIETLGDDLTQLVTSSHVFPTGNSVTIARASGDSSSFSYAELGRVTASSVTRTRNGTPESRNVSFSYYGTNEEGGFPGMLKSETVNPGQTLDKTLTTTYTYDSFGNQASKTTTGWDGESTVDRTTTTTYDATGRYAYTATDALNHTLTRVTARDDYGSPKTIVGLNGLETYKDYDVWGREDYSGANTGAWKSTEILAMPNSSLSCPTDAKTAIVSYDNDSGNQAREYACYDLLGREVRSASLAFDGMSDNAARVVRYIFSDTEYDKSNRVVRVSDPYFSDEAVSHWTRNYYDDLNRVILTVAPNGTHSKVAYSGFTSTLTNPKGQTKQETKNAFDELVSVKDHINGTITYSYTTEGQLRSVNLENTSSYQYGAITGLCAQPSSNLQTVICYDAMGRKSEMWDPDKGHWQYNYNAFGELISQTDGNGNQTTSAYDLLGRAKTRTDYRFDISATPNLQLEGHTRWYYDTTDDSGIQTVSNATLQTTAVVYSNSTSVESLAQGASYVERYTYDILGRPETTTIYLPDGNDYQTRTEYNANNGKVTRTLNVLSDLILRQGSTFESGVVNHYTPLGFLGRITNIEDESQIYEAETFDARSQLKSAMLGGLVSVGYQYYEATGLVKEKTANMGSTTQSISYAWDSVGNLENRITASTSFTNASANLNQREDFCYDALNRLVKTYKNNPSASCPSSSSIYDVRYDGLGNITYKAGIGDYHYGELGVNSHRAGPHALTSLGNNTGRIKFSYDNNGNMLSDDERTFVYSTFNKPTLISNGTHTVEFAYGPGRNRYYRKDAGEETWYLGNVEKIVKSDNTVEWRRYLDGGVIHTYNTNASNQETNSVTKRFMLDDHLGSSNMVLDAVGNIEQVFGFDEWGLRRDFETMSVLSDNDRKYFDTSITKKGFTGHEMIDQLNLVHMNGRIYDPRWGRFIQADPYVPSPTDTQMLNRYSYVRNNPLNATDPEGHNPVLIGMAVGVMLGYIGNAIAQSGQPEIGGVFMMIGCAIAAPSGGGLACAAASAASSTYSATGDFGKSIKAGAITAATGWAFGQLSNQIAQGGAYGSAAGVTPRGLFVSAVVGGTTSKITGGKFTNGAVSGAFFYVIGGGTPEKPKNNVDNGLEETNGSTSSSDPPEHPVRNESLDLVMQEDGSYLAELNVSAEPGQEEQRAVYIEKVSGRHTGEDGCKFLGMWCDPSRTRVLEIRATEYNGPGEGNIHIVSRDTMANRTGKYNARFDSSSYCKDACAAISGDGVGRNWIHIRNTSMGRLQYVHETFHTFGFYHAHKTGWRSIMQKGGGDIMGRDIDLLARTYGF